MIEFNFNCLTYTLNYGDPLDCQLTYKSHTSSQIWIDFNDGNIVKYNITSTQNIGYIYYSAGRFNLTIYNDDRSISYSYSIVINLINCSHVSIPNGYPLSCTLYANTCTKNNTLLVDFGDNQSTQYKNLSSTITIYKTYNLSGNYIIKAYNLANPSNVSSFSISGN